MLTYCFIFLAQGCSVFLFRVSFANGFGSRFAGLGFSFLWFRVPVTSGAGELAADIAIATSVRRRAGVVVGV